MEQYYFIISIRGGELFWTTPCIYIYIYIYLFRIFFHNCKLCIVWNWFIEKNYFDPTKVFVSRLFKVAINQTDYFRFKQRSVIKILVAEKCKRCEICRKMCVVNRDACFNEKNFFQMG